MRFGLPVLGWLAMPALGTRRPKRSDPEKAKKNVQPCHRTRKLRH